MTLAPSSAPNLARAQRAALSAALAVVSLAAWVWLGQHGTRPAGGLFLPPCHMGRGWAGFLAAAAMWQAMSVAMMTPTTLHWLFAYAALTACDAPRRVYPAAVAFLSGYLAVWLGFSVAGAGLQMLLQRSGWLSGDRVSRPAGGIILIAAGAAFFTPVSRACLKHCRNPLTYFLSRWKQGPTSGFRSGAAHGTFCLGCCWALMLTGFAMGTMNLLWMGFLTVVMCVEKLLPRGERYAAVASAALIAWGAALLMGAAGP